MLYDNVTMIGSWIEAQFSNTEDNFKTHDRVINNVSLALPHPGKVTKILGMSVQVFILRQESIRRQPTTRIIFSSPQN